MRRYLRQVWCGLRGHDPVLHFEHGRISLLCTSCGHETPGWDVKNRLPPPAPPARVVRMSLLDSRRAS